MIPKINNKFIGLLNSIVTISLFMVTASPSFALDSEEGESLFFAEVPTVLSTSRIRQSRLDTPVSVTVIDRKTIVDSGFLEVADVMRLVPGFQVARSDARQYAVTYHGKSTQFSARLQLLVDGRSLYHAMLSTIEWNNLGIHIDDIERIEVIRGPNAAAYGANAFIGTVNIITRSPLIDRGESVSLIGGSQSLRQISAKTSGEAKGFHYRLRGNFHKSEGIDWGDDARSLSSLSLRGHYSPTVHDNVDVFVGIDDGTTGAGSTGESVTLGSGREVLLDPRRDRNATNHYQHIRWQRVFNENNDLTVQFYHNYYKQEDAVPLQANLSELFNVTPAQIQAALGQPDQKLILARLDGTSERFDLDIQHTIIAPNRYRLAWGGGVRRDSLESYHHLGTRDAIVDSSARVFVNTELNLTPSVTTNVGIMIEKGDIVDTQYSPRVSINWTFADAQVMRLSAGRAYRNPSLLEANWDYGLRFADGSIADQLFITQDKLKAEKITSYELGVVGEALGQQWLWDVKLFREVIEHGINSADNESYVDPLGTFLPVSAGARIEGNFLSSVTTGIEGQLVYRPTNKTSLAFQYGYSDATLFALIDIEPFVEGFRRRSSPYHTASLLASTRFSNDIAFSVGLYHTGAMRWLGDGDYVPSYNRVDMRLAKTWGIGHGQWTFAWVVQNAFDEYKEFYDDLDAPKQQTYLQLNWKP